MKDITIDLQESDTRKIQLTIQLILTSSKGVEEEPVMNLKSNNTKLMSFDNVNDIVDELFKTLLSRYQNNLETSMKASFLFLIQSKFCITNVIK